MERHELDAWLGDNHGLNDAEIKDLLNDAARIERQYPDPDDAEERGAALVAAYRLLAGENGMDALIEEYGAQLAAARQAERIALASLRELAGAGRPEATFARLAGIDRMTVRKWAGKR